MIGEVQGTIGANGKRIWLYPREITGWFTKKRNQVAWILMALYLGLPWLKFRGQSLILFDWTGQKIILLGNNFWIKDLPIFLPLFFSFILIVLLTTARYGRIWCGWACPQTVFLQFLFAPIEKFFEGQARHRLARDKKPWTWDWVWRKAGKHFTFAFVAWWIGNTALAYGWGMDNLLQAISHPSHDHIIGLILVLSFTFLFYANFAFFREQACILVCPYARFQSVIPDENTSLIAYDSLRGEKRGKGENGKREGFGDCTDCRQCVLVCPTGIDIRQGQQLECIGSARCIDACDRTMTAWKKPVGLIRYASLRELEGRNDPKKKPLPWRLIAYAVMATIMAVISLTLIFNRPTIGIDAVRRGTAPYSHFSTDSILNTYTLYLRNNGSKPRVLRLKSNSKDSQNENSYSSNWDGQVFALSGGQILAIPLDLKSTAQNFIRGKRELHLKLMDAEIQVPFEIELVGPWGK